MPKRFIDYDLEADRTAEWLLDNKKDFIQDKNSFELTFNIEIAETTEEKLTKKQKDYRNIVFKKYLNFFTKEEQVLLKQELFKDAKGKDLRRDILKTAKRVVKTREQFKKETASKVDLERFDVLQKQLIEKIKEQKFELLGRIKGRTVRVIKTSVIVLGKSQIRFRNAKGRFASLKIK